MYIPRRSVTFTEDSIWTAKVLGDLQTKQHSWTWFVYFEHASHTLIALRSAQSTVITVTLYFSAVGYLHNSLLVTTLRLCGRPGSYSCFSLTGFKFRFFIPQPLSSKIAIPIFRKRPTVHSPQVTEPERQPQRAWLCSDRELESPLGASPQELRRLGSIFLSLGMFKICVFRWILNKNQYEWKHFNRGTGFGTQSLSHLLEVLCHSS